MKEELINKYIVTELDFSKDVQKDILKQVKHSIYFCIWRNRNGYASDNKFCEWCVEWDRERIKQEVLKEILHFLNTT